MPIGRGYIAGTHNTHHINVSLEPVCFQICKRTLRSTCQESEEQSLIRRSNIYTVVKYELRNPDSSLSSSNFVRCNSVSL